MVRLYHLLYILHHKVCNDFFCAAQQITHFRDDHRLDGCLSDNFFQVVGEVGEDDNRDGAAVLELMLHLARCVERIRIHENKSRLQCTEHGHGELQNIRHLNGNPVPGF